LITWLLNQFNELRFDNPSMKRKIRKRDFSQNLAKTPEIFDSATFSLGGVTK